MLSCSRAQLTRNSEPPAGRVHTDHHGGQGEGQHVRPRTAPAPSGFAHNGRRAQPAEPWLRLNATRCSMAGASCSRGRRCAARTSATSSIWRTWECAGPSGSQSWCRCRPCPAGWLDAALGNLVSPSTPQLPHRPYNQPPLLSPQSLRELTGVCRLRPIYRIYSPCSEPEAGRVGRTRSGGC